MPVSDYCSSLDLAYHRISSSGIYNILEASGFMRKLVSDELIAHAMVNPPANTRAAIRGDFIRFLAEHGYGGSAENWQSLTLIDKDTGSEDPKKYILGINNPFDNNSEEWNNLKASLLERRRTKGNA